MYGVRKKSCLCLDFEKEIQVEAYKRAYPEKDNNASQIDVGKVWKKMKVDFPAANKLEEEVRSKRMENLVIYKKSKINDYWSNLIQKKKSKMTNKSLETTSQETSTCYYK